MLCICVDLFPFLAFEDLSVFRDETKTGKGKLNYSLGKLIKLDLGSILRFHNLR